MGTWGTGLFQDDVALDAKGIFEDALNEGLDVRAATRRVVAEFIQRLDDADDMAIAYLALASLQWKHQQLQPSIRRKALSILSSGQGLERWEGTNGYARRKRVLEQLRRRLTDQAGTGISSLSEDSLNTRLS